MHFLDGEKLIFSITWYDTNNSVVVNNTVLGGSDYPGLPPGSEGWPTRTWISVEGTGNTVRNNITTRNLSGGDHNIEIQPEDDVDLVFRTGSGSTSPSRPDRPRSTPATRMGPRLTTSSARSVITTRTSAHTSTTVLPDKRGRLIRLNFAHRSRERKPEASW